MPQNFSQPYEHSPPDDGLLFSAFSAPEENAIAGAGIADPATPPLLDPNMLSDIGFDFEPDDDSTVGALPPPPPPPRPRPVDTQEERLEHLARIDRDLADRARNDPDLLAQIRHAPEKIPGLDSTVVEQIAIDPLLQESTAYPGGQHYDPGKTTIEKKQHQTLEQSSEDATDQFDTLAMLQQREQERPPPSDESVWPADFVVPPAERGSNDALVDSLFDEDLQGDPGFGPAASNVEVIDDDVLAEIAENDLPPDVGFVAGDVLPPELQPEKRSFGSDLEDDGGPEDILARIEPATPSPSLSPSTGEWDDADTEMRFDDFHPNALPPAMESMASEIAAGDMLPEEDDTHWQRLPGGNLDADNEPNWNVIPQENMPADDLPEQNWTETNYTGNDSELSLGTLPAKNDQSTEPPSFSDDTWSGGNAPAELFNTSGGTSIDDLFEDDDLESASLPDMGDENTGVLLAPAALGGDLSQAAPVKSALPLDDATFSGGELPDIPHAEEMQEGESPGDMRGDDSAADLFAQMGSSEEDMDSPATPSLSDEERPLHPDTDIEMGELPNEAVSSSPRQTDDAGAPLDNDKAISDLFSSFPEEERDAPGIKKGTPPAKETADQQAGSPEEEPVIAELPNESLPDEDDLIREGRAGDSEKKVDTLELLEAGLMSEEGNAEAVEELFQGMPANPEDLEKEFEDIPAPAEVQDDEFDSNAELPADLPFVGDDALPPEMDSSESLADLFGDNGEHSPEEAGDPSSAHESSESEAPKISLLSAKTGKILVGMALAKVDELADLRRNWGLYVDLVALTILTISSAVILAAWLHT